MHFARHFIAAAATLALSTPALSQFSPAGPTVTGTVGAQTLSSGTGTIQAGGAIRISTNGVALSMTGTSTLVNHGAIETTGTGRAIDSNTGTANLAVTNTGLIRSVATDAFRVNTNSAVSLTNSGTIEVINGGQAIDWAAVTSASNSLTNLAGGVISTVGEDAVRPGTGGVISNAGTIRATPTGTTSPSGSDGVDVRTFTGIQISNSGLITGRHGIATDGNNGISNASDITIHNLAGGVLQAQNGSGVNIDGVFTRVTATITNAAGGSVRGGLLAAATVGDGDGIDVDGILTLTNAGDILGLGAKGASNNAEGIAAGGGSITNTATGRIIGSTRLADAPHSDPTRAGNGILIDDSNGGSAIAPTTVTNSGLIQGLSGFAIKLIGSFANTVTNWVGGVIEGAGNPLQSGAALQTGNGNDVVVNAGSVIGLNGRAIDLQGGNNTLVIQGGMASITGDVDGGTGGKNTLRLEVGAGQQFVYGGRLSNFHRVEVQSGLTVLQGDNAFTDTLLALSGGDLRLDRAGEVFFGSLSLLEDAVLDLAGVSSLTFGAVDSLMTGKGLTVLGGLGQGSIPYAIRFLGDLTGRVDFLGLAAASSINGLPARFSFDGAYTLLAPMERVPAPSTVTMLVLGLGLLGAGRRRLARCTAGRRGAAA